MNTEHTRPATDDNVDTWLRILANEQRRAVVAYLRENGECRLSDLAEYVAGEVNPNRSGEPSPPELDRTTTALVHIHLPMMDDAGIIDWNREDSVVRAASVPEHTPWS